jgi:hypothetical protein
MVFLLREGRAKENQDGLAPFTTSRADHGPPFQPFVLENYLFNSLLSQ